MLRKVYIIVLLFIFSILVAETPNEKSGKELRQILDEIEQDLNHYEFDDSNNLIRNKIITAEQILNNDEKIAQLAEWSHISDIHNLLGLGYRAAKDYTNAFRKFKQALDSRKCDKSLEGETEKEKCAKYYFNYGNAYFLKGNFLNQKGDLTKSIEQFEKSSNYFRSAKSKKDLLSAALEQSGKAYTNIGDFQNAKIVLHEAKNLYSSKELGRHKILLTTGKLLLAKAFKEKDNSLEEEAFKTFTEAEENYKEAINSKESEEVYLGLAKSKVGKIEILEKKKPGDNEELDQLTTEVINIYKENEKSKISVGIYHELYKVYNLRADRSRNEGDKKKYRLMAQESIEKEKQALQSKKDVRVLNEKINSSDLDKQEFERVYAYGMTHLIHAIDLKKQSRNAEAAVEFKKCMDIMTEGREYFLKKKYLTANLEYRNIYLAFLEGIILSKNEFDKKKSQKELEEVVLQLTYVHDEPGYKKQQIINKYIYLYKFLFDIYISEKKYEDAFLLDLKRRALSILDEDKYQAAVKVSKMSVLEKSEFFNDRDTYNELSIKLGKQNEFKEIQKINTEMEKILERIDAKKEKFKLNTTTFDSIRNFNIDDFKKVLSSTKKGNKRNEHVLTFSFLSDEPYLFHIGNEGKLHTYQLNISTHVLARKIENLYSLINFDRDTLIAEFTSQDKSEIIILNQDKNENFQNINKYFYENGVVKKKAKIRNLEARSFLERTHVEENIEIAKNVKKEIKKISSQNEEEVNAQINKSLLEIYDIVFLPIEKTVSNGDRLILIPDGVMNYLPFAAIPNKSNILLDDLYILQQNYSALVWLNNRKERLEKDKLYKEPIYFMGNPLYTSEESQRNLAKELVQFDKNWKNESSIVEEKKAIERFLEEYKVNFCGNKREVKDYFIRTRWPESHQYELIDSEKIEMLCSLKITSDEKFKKFSNQILQFFYKNFFTNHLLQNENVNYNELSEKSKTLFNNYRILHFSTHGYVDYSDFENNSLLLSNPYALPLKDGKVNKMPMHLTVNDIIKWDIESDLVVLAACSTSIGPEVAGEGVMGLPYAFINSGASFVISTMWKAIPLFSDPLLEKMYKNIQIQLGTGEKLLDYAEMLSNARKYFRTHLDSNKKISHWALFVSYGD